MIDLNYRPLRYRDRWFAYVDLLGFTNLVQSNSIKDVLPIYSEALNRMRKASKLGKKEVGLLSSWFSDTFIIYTRSDSLQDFTHLESAARNFFELLIMKNIPARGCISHGKLYSQAKQNIFIGPALIEAHTYGEALDWIGFCLAPSIESKLENDLPLDQRAFYRRVSDRNILRGAPAEYLYAYAFNNGIVNGKNPFREKIKEMKQSAPSRAVKKYENTLAFLENA